MDLSKFACPCGRCTGPDAPPPELVTILVRLERVLGSDAMITSGYRCPEKNAAVGGAARSRHLQGDAVDLFMPGVMPAAIFYLLDNEYPDRLGLGLYKNHTHIDLRPGRARWDLT